MIKATATAVLEDPDSGTPQTSGAVPMHSFLELAGATVRYTTLAGSELTAISDVSLQVKEAEFLVIIGRSGCGKTTLLNLIAGLISPTTGSVTLMGRPITKPGRDRGVVFQADAVFPWKRVAANLDFALKLGGTPRHERPERIAQFLKLVGLEHAATLYPKELSGGMSKRLAIAMVLANRPDILLMDEPFGPLDYATRVELQIQLEEIRQSRPLTTVFVTHDVEEAVFLADRVIVMAKSEIIHEMDVPLARPRGLSVRKSPEFGKIASELLEQIIASRGRQ